VYGVSYQYVLDWCMEFLIKIYARLVYVVSNKYVLGWCMEFLIKMCSIGVWSSYKNIFSVGVWSF
jgi:hypothetical protein